VPEGLLALFDENELELLISGVRDYKLAELKACHTVISGTPLRDRFYKTPIRPKTVRINFKFLIFIPKQHIN
jgi:hypothetical protein